MAKKTRQRLPLEQKQKLLAEADKLGDPAIIKKYKVSQASLWRWRKTGVAGAARTNGARKARNAVAKQKVREIAREVTATVEAQKPSLLALLELVENRKLTANDAYSLAESLRASA